MVKAAVAVVAASIAVAVCAIGTSNVWAAASPRYIETWNPQEAPSARVGQGRHEAQVRPVAARRRAVSQRHVKVRVKVRVKVHTGVHAHAAQVAHAAHGRGSHVEKHAGRLRAPGQTRSASRHASVAPHGHHAASKTARTSAKRDSQHVPHGKPKLVVQTRPSHAQGAGKPQTRELPPILS
ncbi:hypothetical protein [Paraburkholderia kururiensis]|uniref:hypothetical protein n=1 Tax=Paraburkholderia kururiensis TaxID=984307 RepID=UPI000F88C70C|nr:hypothetical protein [Paraburkholderia kururiensis]